MTQEEITAFTNGLRENAFLRKLPVMRMETSRVLAEVAADLNPAETLEIGTCVGVSGLTVLNACGTRLTTVEISEERWLEAKKNFEKCGFSSRVNAYLGDCREIIPLMKDNGYDLAVFDCQKSAYGVMFDFVMPMLRRGGVAFFDDTAYHGMIDGDYSEHKQRTIITSMRAFLARLSKDKRLKITTYGIGDGITVAKKLVDDEKS
jgi:predicted O-methyltransferase YrrM